ncbi:ATP-binding protein [Planobispora siamensis]|uniref:histidine kinase n=1 Tax=Planobispora siamensis TaxID=936338 RepID=A0A8J3SCA3_9ACTN|nr:ATP-binding protein [Planobispora siamensis]GIH89961.1 hypothetical protein Psi01_05910 [Planobispora siamensis]
MPYTEQEKALVALLDSVTGVVNTADSLEPAARAMMAAVCELTGWPLGHLCVPDDSGGFVSSGVWVGAVERFTTLREVTARTRFTPGRGIVGEAVATGEPVWSHDVVHDPLFVRAREEPGLGVGAALAFPIVAAHGVVAVLEFFRPEPAPPDTPLLRVVANLGHQLGRVVDRERSRRALEAGRRRLEEMVETSVEAFVAMDASGRIIGWNAAAERMFSLPRDRALGRPLSETIIPPVYRESHRKGLERFLTTGRARILGQRIEVPAYRPDGSEFPVQLAIWAFQDEGQWVFNAFMNDITDYRRAQEALRTAYERELATVARLKELDEAKTGFIATVSHELRTPLTTLIGYLEVLIDGDAGPVNDRQGRMLQAMNHNAVRLQHLVEDLLAVNTADAGLLTVDPVLVMVGDVLETALEGMAMVSRTRDHTIDVDIDENVGPIEADPVQFSRALRALLSNAVKFSAPGAPVTVRVSSAGDAVSIAVTDTGIGIPEDELPHVFDRFYRTRLAADHAVQGIGLGLTIAKDIVDAHGGTLTATSAPERGSTFTITLPTPGATLPESPGNSHGPGT